MTLPRFVPDFSLSLSRNTTLAAVAVLLVACAATPEDRRPGWVDDPAGTYDPSLYVTGLGEAGSAALARDRARADLAKAFEVAIRAETIDVETWGREGPVGMEEERIAMRVERELRTHTDIVLQAVDIAESWQDPESGRHYVLAVVSKPRAATRLRDEIRDLDRTTLLHVEEAAAAETLPRLRALDRAVETQVRRAALQQQLRVVDVGGRGIEPPVALAELTGEYRRTASGLAFAIRADGEGRSALERALSTAIADAGFGHEPEGTGHVLVAGLELDDLGQRSDWHWYRGYLNLEVRDAEGRVLAGERWAVRASAGDAQTARRRAIEEAVQRIEQDLVAVVLAGD